MPITIRSPYSGNLVKVRDQDISRAVRDEEGRIFYVVHRADGKGYYSSPTRAGSEKDEQRYLEMEAKIAAVGAAVKESSGASAGQAASAVVHDATGPGKAGSGWRWLMVLILLLAAAAVVYVILAFGSEITGEGGWLPTWETPEEQRVPRDLPADEMIPQGRIDTTYDVQASLHDWPLAQAA